MAESALRACLHAAFWLPLAVCTWLALMPVPPDAVFHISDVIQHGVAFASLTFALRLAFPALGPAAAGLWMVGYGALLEVVQALGGARTGEFGDLAVDAVAILTGLALHRLLGARVRGLVLRLVQAVVR